MECDDFGGEPIVFRILLALVDPDVEIEVRRLDPSKAIFAGVVEVSPLIFEEPSNVSVECVGGYFDIVLADPPDKGPRGLALAIRHMMVLLETAQSSDTPSHGPSDPALMGVRGICWFRSDGGQIGAAYRLVQLRMSRFTQRDWISCCAEMTICSDATPVVFAKRGVRACTWTELTRVR